MWKVEATDNRGTYYPIAFFLYKADAEKFVVAESAKWTLLHIEYCESAVLHGVIADASNWRMK